jgi:Transcription factor Pcc1
VKKLEAEITLSYDDEHLAEAVADAVSPDNFKTPSGLTVTTTRKNSTVSTTIKCKKGLPTFIATIDDLLFCFSIAEKTVQTTKKL